MQTLTSAQKYVKTLAIELSEVWKFAVTMSHPLARHAYGLAKCKMHMQWALVR